MVQCIKVALCLHSKNPHTTATPLYVSHIENYLRCAGRIYKIVFAGFDMMISSFSKGGYWLLFCTKLCIYFAFDTYVYTRSYYVVLCSCEYIIAIECYVYTSDIEDKAHVNKPILLMVQYYVY